MGQRIAFGRKPTVNQLSEEHVTKQVKDFLEWRGWRAIRFQRTMVQLPGGGAFSTGEPGQADWQFVRYIESESVPGAAVVLWVEMKATGKRAYCICATKRTHQRCTACDQISWKARERKRGAVVWTIDSLDVFMREYNRTSGYLHKGDMAVGQMLIDV